MTTPPMVEGESHGILLFLYWEIHAFDKLKFNEKNYNLLLNVIVLPQLGTI